MGIGRSLAIILLIVSSGCASMAKYDNGHTYPFGATYADLGMLKHAIDGKPEDEPANAFDFLYSPWFLPLFLLDLPFSVVTDLVTLGYDLQHLDEVGAGCLGPENGASRPTAPGAAPTPQEELGVREAALASMLARWNRNAPNEAVSIELQASPGVHPSATTWIRGVLDDGLRMYGPYAGQGPGRIRAVFSLDKSWCLDVQEAMSGHREAYLCEQDGGLNAGSGWQKGESILFARPWDPALDPGRGEPPLSAFTREGAGELLDAMGWELHFVYEMGHATHGLLMSELTGEGYTPFVPVLLEVGAARMAAYAYAVAVRGESEDEWREFVFERRSPQRAKLTSYAHPLLATGGEYHGDAIEWPRIYTLGFLAGEYIVGTYGDEALFDQLIPLLMSNGGDQDAAYRSVLGVTPEELTTALDAYAFEQLSAVGHELSRP